LWNNSVKIRPPVITELNGQIIKVPQRESIVLKDGDTVELVSFVGGGSLIAGCSLLVTRKTNKYEQRTTNNKQLS